VADLEANKALTRALYEGVWRDRRVELVDDILAPDFVLHIGGAHVGREATGNAFENVWIAAFPDLTVEMNLQVAEGDLVADHITFSGTHTGLPFQGIEPTGAEFSFTQTTISRIEDGRIAEIWEDFDWRGLVRQLGG
jgi:predicted ester cyclase